MKQFLSSLYSVTKTHTIKDAFIVTLGMALSTLLSAASIFIIARILGPAGFGLYVTALAIVVIVIDSLDLAIGGSIIKFASQKTPQSAGHVKHGFYLKLVLGIVIGILFAVISQFVANWLHPQFKTPLLVASLFIPVVFLLRFPRSLLQAQKKFLADSSIEVFTSFLRLLFVAVFFWWFKLTVVTALLAYLIGAIGAFILGSVMISWDFLKASVSPKIKAGFFSFQKWLTFGFVIAAIHGRIDAAILLRLAGPSITGIYQAGYRFFMPVIQLAVALSLVFAPRFASFPSRQQAKIYLAKTAKLSLALAALVLLIIPLAGWLIQLIFGSQYQGAVLPTQILAFGFAAFLAGAPFVSHLIYATSRTQLFFIINLFQLVLLVALDLVLIPGLGAVGAALATSTTLLIVNGLLAGLAFSYQKAGTSS